MTQRLACKHRKVSVGSVTHYIVKHGLEIETCCWQIDLLSYFSPFTVELFGDGDSLKESYFDASLTSSSLKSVFDLGRKKECK